jgi:signal transduction histidine kinase
MPTSDPRQAREILSDIVHDLRQPLGNIQTGIFVLRSLLADAPPQVAAQLAMLERQTEEAARILQAQCQRAGPSGSRAFTSSETAALT